MKAEIPDLGYTPTIGEITRRAAAAWPDKDFVVMPDRRITFADAERQSRVLGKRLLAAGYGKGSRIGVFDTYSTEWVIVWLAAARIGALIMPFSSIYKPAELRTVLRIGDVQLLFAPASFLGRDVPAFLEEAVPGLAGASAGPLLLNDMPYLREVWMWGGAARPWATAVDVPSTDDGGVSDELFDAVEAEVVPADLAQVTYTSGSSALPKGVVHSQAAIVRTTYFFGQNRLAPESDKYESKILCGFPFFWIGGTLVLGGALQSGITVCVIEKFDAGPALDMVENERCTSVAAWPSLVQSMKAHPTFASRDLDSMPSLTEPGPSDFALIGSPVPGIPRHRGMSETVGNWWGAERKIVNPETGETLPDMEEGELWIRGHGVMQAYYKQERESVFDADGWLHTGDRCFMFENQPYFVGRFYEMIKSQGANVSPREVELYLEGWPEIEHALVFGLPHPVLEEEVTAVIVFKPGMRMTPQEIQDRARKEISSFKVPSRIEIIDDEANIPWLGSGKPDKLAVRARLIA